MDLTPQTDLAAVANVAMPAGTELATFTDANSQAATADFLAIVTWESGRRSTGAVTFDPTQDQFVVSGSYTYGDLGWHNAEVNVYDAGGNVASGNATINVTDGQLTAAAATVDIGDLDAGDVVYVGNITAENPAAVSADFSVSTNWGDGDVDNDGFVVPAGPNESDGFDVYATRSTDYTGGSAPIQVTVTEDQGQSGSATTSFDCPLALDSGSTVTLTGLPSGSDLSIGSGTTWDLAGQSFDLGAGTVTLDGGAIIDSEGNGLLDASSFSVENGAISANLSGGPLSLTGGGYVALTGDNGVSSVAIAGTGTLAVGPNALGQGPITFSAAGTLQALGNLSLGSSQTIATPDDPILAATIDSNGYDVAAGGTVSGRDNLVKIGDGTLNLGGVNNTGLQGELVINGGFVAADGMSSLGSGALVFDGGGLRWSAPFDIPCGQEINVGSGGATFDTNGLVAEIDATIGTIYPDGNTGGVTVMDGSSTGGGVLIVDGQNICQQGTTIASGTLAIAADAALGAPDAPLTFSGPGTLRATAPLALGASPVVITPDDPSLAATIDSDGNQVVIPGLISGDGGLTATNTNSAGASGSLELSNGGNNFSGVTIVAAGDETLVLGSPTALQQSTFDTSGPGCLNFNGFTNVIFGGLQGDDNMTLAPGFSLQVGGNGFTTTLSGSLLGSGTLNVVEPGDSFSPLTTATLRVRQRSAPGLRWRPRYRLPCRPPCPATPAAAGA